MSKFLLLSININGNIVLKLRCKINLNMKLNCNFLGHRLQKPYGEVWRRKNLMHGLWCFHYKENVSFEKTKIIYWQAFCCFWVYIHLGGPKNNESYGFFGRLFGDYTYNNVKNDNNPNVAGMLPLKALSCKSLQFHYNMTGEWLNQNNFSHYMHEHKP
jgi:hypothetical protein